MLHHHPWNCLGIWPTICEWWEGHTPHNSKVHKVWFTLIPTFLSNVIEKGQASPQNCHLFPLPLLPSPSPSQHLLFKAYLLLVSSPKERVMLIISVAMALYIALITVYGLEVEEGSGVRHNLLRVRLNDNGMKPRILFILSLSLM